MNVAKGAGKVSRTGDGRPPICTSRRGQLALRRWLEVLSAGIVGAAAILLLLRWRRYDLHILVDIPLWALLGGGICLSALLYQLGESRWSAFTGVRHLPSFPPIWVGSLFGAGIILLILGGISPIRRDLLVADESGRLMWLVGVLCTAAVVLLALASVASFLFRHPGENIASHQDILYPAQTFVSFEKLSEWLAQDEVLTCAADDVFGHARIAHRIAERLLEPRPPAQAVVGRLGAGKTTLRSLVEDALARMGGERSRRCRTGGASPARPCPPHIAARE